MPGEGQDQSHHRLADGEYLPDEILDAVIYYGIDTFVTKLVLLADLEKTGILLLKCINPESTDELIRLGRMLGTTDVGIEEELLGATVMHLRHNPDITPKNQQPAYFTSDYFPLHTDVSYVPNPPRFMLLHCVNQDPEGGGSNLLADCNQALALLTDEERAKIRQPVFNFLYPPNCVEGQSLAYAISGSGLWRYKHSSMRFPQDTEVAVARFNQALIDVSITLLLERGDMLIVDNHRIAHGRTGFNHADPKLPGRHFMRLYANTLS